MNVLRLMRTVRYLRPVQIYGRVAHRFARPTPDLRPAPPRATLDTRTAPGAERAASMLGSSTFRFLNVVGDVATPSDWDDPARARLWRYNLHYFDDLNAAGAAERAEWHRALIARWIRENPPARGTGWEPYPTSLRIVNWIRWALCQERVDAAMLDSLAIQTRWLTRRLERHILGNHLWANAKALVFAGVFFTGDEADQWLRLGTTLIDEGLDEQILADGGHFELSPMYTSILLEDVLDLINLAIASPRRIDPSFVAKLRTTATRMLRWLRVMSHPDGRIAFFNDAAFGIAPSYTELAEYARRLGVTVNDAPLASIEPLANSGYVRLSRGPATVICDVGPIGPDHLPAHGHADALSFEFSYEARRVCVNTGTSTYDTSPERERQRGTAAHNTVVVDGRDSSEVWASFRVGRRARPFNVSWHRDDQTGELRVTASHDGYGKTTHTRTWTFDDTGLTIDDRVVGAHQSASARFHLAPDVRAHITSDRSIALDSAGCRLVVQSDDASVRLSASTWNPEFGQSIPNQVIAIDVPPSGLRTKWSWK